MAKHIVTHDFLVKDRHNSPDFSGDNLWPFLSTFLRVKIGSKPNINQCISNFGANPVMGQQLCDGFAKVIKLVAVW